MFIYIIQKLSRDKYSQFVPSRVQLEDEDAKFEISVSSGNLDSFHEGNNRMMLVIISFILVTLCSELCFRLHSGLSFF